MAFIDDILPYFQFEDVPTEAQFLETFTKLRWKDEKITAADLHEDLLSIINSYARLIALPQGVLQRDIRRETLIEKFVIRSTVDNAVLNVSVGTTPGGNDIIDAIECDLSDKQNGIVSKDYHCFEDKTFYFTITGSPADSIQINIYKS